MGADYIADIFYLPTLEVEYSLFHLKICISMSSVYNGGFPVLSIVTFFIYIKKISLQCVRCHNIQFKPCLDISYLTIISSSWY